VCVCARARARARSRACVCVYVYVRVRVCVCVCAWLTCIILTSKAQHHRNIFAVVNLQTTFQRQFLGIFIFELSPYLELE